MARDQDHMTEGELAAARGKIHDEFDEIRDDLDIQLDEGPVPSEGDEL